MKKILLSLALALMASASFVANAGNPPGLVSSELLSPSPVDISIFGNKISICFFPERVVYVSIRNLDTGEFHSVDYSPARCLAELPFSRDSGTWRISARGEGSFFYFRQFYFYGDPGKPHRPVDWIDEGDPIHITGPFLD